MTEHSELPIAVELRKRASTVSLSTGERSRFSRHILLPEISENGQKAFKAARVLIVGTGGLGSPVSLYLAAAGIGHIGLIDFDRVDTSNLQRQIVFSEADEGKSKVGAAAERLAGQNSHILVEAIDQRLGADNILEHFQRFDIIVDGTDNFSTRYMINDAAVLLKKPVVYGSIFRFDGQVSLFYPMHGPCYRCLFPKAPPAGQIPNCAEGGVLGVLPGIIGVIQATETLKLIAGIGESLIGRLLTYDSLAMRFAEFSFKNDPACAVCGTDPVIKSVTDTTDSCGIGLSDSVRTVDVNEISVEDFIELQKHKSRLLLIDVRSAQERDICCIPGSIHIPLAELSARQPELARDIPIIIHCKSGQRSRSATQLLTSLGYEQVASLAGGILSWIDASGADLATY